VPSTALIGTVPHALFFNYFASWHSELCLFWPQQMLGRSQCSNTGARTFPFFCSHFWFFAPTPFPDEDVSPKPPVSFFPPFFPCFFFFFPPTQMIDAIQLLWPVFRLPFCFLSLFSSLPNLLGKSASLFGCCRWPSLHINFDLSASPVVGWFRATFWLQQLWRFRAPPTSGRPFRSFFKTPKNHPFFALSQDLLNPYVLPFLLCSTLTH